MRKNGWRPRRTLVFCSWAAEEFSLMGSEEWVQDKINKIMDRSVGMINVDMCVQGDIPSLRSSASMKDVVMESLRNIQHWNEKRSIYDVYYDWYNSDKSPSESEDPGVDLLGSGSDHTDFIFFAGVPTIDMSFVIDYKKYKVYDYPAYHTGYETFYLVDEIMDPGFKIHKACSQLSIYQMMKLSESLVLPYNVRDLFNEMRKAMDDIIYGEAGMVLTQHNISLAHVTKAIDDFGESTLTFDNYVKFLDKNSDPVILKMINDQLLRLERVFLLPEGLPAGRTKYRHAIFSPSKFNSYGGAAFPGIDDLLYGIDRLQGDDLTAREKELKKHISDLMIVIQNAASFLQPLFKL